MPSENRTEICPSGYDLIKPTSLTFEDPCGCNKLGASGADYDSEILPCARACTKRYGKCINLECRKKIALANKVETEHCDNSDLSCFSAQYQKFDKLVNENCTP